MRFLTIGIFGNTAPVIGRLIRAGARFSRTGLFEAGVGVLLIVWWVQVAMLVMHYLQWAAILDFRP